MKPWC